MSHTYTLQREQFIPRPLAEVAAFFADAGNLEILTPEFLHFKILTPLPIDMKTGALIDYQIRLFGIPFRWRTRIEDFDLPRKFVDTQISGPYKLWHHTHLFEEVEGGVKMTDIVKYQMPMGPIGWMVHALHVKKTLTTIFDYRFEKIRQLFPINEEPRRTMGTLDVAEVVA